MPTSTFTVLPTWLVYPTWISCSMSAARCVLLKLSVCALDALNTTRNVPHDAKLLAVEADALLFISQLVQCGVGGQHLRYALVGWKHGNIYSDERRHS